MYAKDRNPHLSRKNITDCFAFTKQYEYWTIDDQCYEIFQMEEFGVGLMIQSSC